MGAREDIHDFVDATCRRCKRKYEGCVSDEDDKNKVNPNAICLMQEVKKIMAQMTYTTQF